MILARVFTAAAGCVLLGAAVASCSGSFGSGSGMPNTLASPSFGGPSTPTPPPNQSSVIVTYGESTAFQSLPEVAGYGGSIAFPKAPDPTAAPAAKGKTPRKDGSPEPAAAAPTPVAIAIGATLSTVKPQDGPDLNFVSGKGKKKRTREQPARALAYITLLPTHDVTLESYPRIAIDIPRDIASQYRDGEFGLALWNSGEKDAKYRMAVAELDAAATPPPLRGTASIATPAVNASPGASGKPGVATPPPTPNTITRTSGTAASPGPAGSAGPGGMTSPGPGGAIPTAVPTLPPARLVFAGTVAQFKLVANRPAVFALYALPHPSATPVPKASVAPAG
ncbi:MAG: hypothetical protein JWO66_2047, partial [Candidatus Eremiobacteraeota bacterium]|nr:hypothetical protein [Candidatus Eremiobacteraeota bacterium]